MTNSPSLRRGTILALTTAGISGISLFINTFAVSGIHDPVVFTTAKNVLVALALIGIIQFSHSWHEVRRLTNRQWSLLATIGLIGGSLPFALFFTGLQMVPALDGALIYNTLFVWVALLAIVFLRERFSPLQWLGVGALFAANMLVPGFNGLTFGMGDLLILAATLLWAFESILAKYLLGELTSTVVAGACRAFGALFLLAFLVVSGRIEGVADLTPIGSGWTLLTAVLLCGYVLTWYTALKHAPASYVAALLVPATLVTNILSAVFVTGTLTQHQLLTGILSVFGIAMIIHYARQSACTLSAAVQPANAR
jgi:drug/metabolite transporter (DMT)-like permease